MPGISSASVPHYIDLNSGALTLMCCPMSQSSSHSARPPPSPLPNRRKNAPGNRTPSLSKTPPLIRRLQRREEDRRSRKPPRWFVPLTTSLQRPHPHQKQSHGRNQNLSWARLCAGCAGQRVRLSPPNCCAVSSCGDVHILCLSGVVFLSAQFAISLSSAPTNLADYSETARAV